MTLLGLFWFVVAIGILVAYLVLVKFDVPQLMKDSFLYGKLRGEGKFSFIPLFEVPKRHFKCFYEVGVVVNGSFVVLMCYCYLYHVPIFSTLKTICKWLTINENNLQREDELSLLLLGCLMTIQNIRRLVECIYISSYSKSSMNIIHFFIGVFLYSTFPLIILMENPSPENGNVQFYDILHPNNVLGIFLFAWSSYHHHRTHKILANLRTSTDGTLKNLNHFIPRGGAFKYVSCPHYLFEVLIYLSFTIVDSFKSSTLLSLFFFVVVNQIVSAFLTDNWYREKFSEYPKHRKAIIPYLL